MLTNHMNAGLLLSLWQANETVLTVSRCSRRLLVAEHSLHEQQRVVVETLYTEAIRESHRLRIQCMLQEAEPALLSGKAFLVPQMMAMCRESVAIVWPVEKETDPLDTEEQEVVNHVLQKVAAFEDSASKSVTAASDMKDNGHGLHEYLSSLPSQHWSSLSF